MLPRDKQTCKLGEKKLTGCTLLFSTQPRDGNIATRALRHRRPSLMTGTGFFLAYISPRAEFMSRGRPWCSDSRRAGWLLGRLRPRPISILSRDTRCEVTGDAQEPST